MSECSLFPLNYFGSKGAIQKLQELALFSLTFPLMSRTKTADIDILKLFQFTNKKYKDRIASENNVYSAVSVK